MNALLIVFMFCGQMDNGVLYIPGSMPIPVPNEKMKEVSKQYKPQIFPIGNKNEVCS